MNLQPAIYELSQTSCNTESFLAAQTSTTAEIKNDQLSLPEEAPGNGLLKTTPSGQEKIIPLPTLSSSAKQPFIGELLAEWSGYVTSIPEHGAFFTASLKGIKGDGVVGEEEDAMIPIEEIGKYDLELLKPGNFFRLCVIHDITDAGEPERRSIVVFRRLPAYRKQDLDDAMERGKELARGLRVE